MNFKGENKVWMIMKIIIMKQLKEIRRLRIVVREYQEDINLLNAFIDSRCKIDGISETIQTLKSLGATEQLLSRIEEINKQISFY